MIHRTHLAVRARRGVALAALVAGSLLCCSASVLGQSETQTDASSTSGPPSETPTSLAASVQSAGVTLSWTAPTLDADTVGGYRVSRKRILEYPTTWTTVAEDTGQTATAYVDATANVNGAKYEYRVSALRGEGDDQTESGYSNVVDVTIPNPPRPVDLTATSTDDGVQLSWSTGHLTWQSVSLSLTGYEIRRIETAHSDNPDPEWEVLVANTNSTDTTYVDASGYTTIEYSYAIRAVHGYLHSYWEGIAGPVSGHLTPMASTEE